MSSAPVSKRSTFDFRYRTIDLVTIATLGVAFGVVFWGWGKLYALVSTTAVFTFPPSVALISGGWLIAGVVGGLIIRKPGAALATEVIAAGVSALLPGNEWGSSVLVSGAVQGLGAELIFAIFLYRRFSIMVATLAGALAGAFESVYEWQVWYADWNLDYKLIHMGMFMLAGAVTAGIGGWLLVRALATAGALDSFGPGQDVSEEI